MSDAKEAPAPVSAARLCAMLLLSPSKAFRRLREEPLKTAATWYVTLLLVNLLLTGVAAFFRYQYLATTWPHGYHPPLFLSLAGTLLLPLITVTLGMFLFCLLFHALVRLSGGREGIARTFAVLLYASTPVLLTFWIFEALWINEIPLSPFIFPVFIVWAIVLTVVGTREVHGISTARAVLPFLTLVVLILVLTLALLFIVYTDPCGGSCYHVTSAAATCTGGNIIVAYQGGMDASTLINITAYDTDPANSRVMGGPDGILPTGSTLVLAGPFFSPAHVVAIAHYQDGTDQVILDTMMECGSGPVKTRTPAIPPTEKMATVITTTLPGTPALRTPGTTIPVTPGKSHEFQHVFVDGCWDVKNITLEYRYDLDPKAKVDFLNWSVNGREMSPRLDASNATAIIPYTVLKNQSDLVLFARFKDGYIQQTYVSWCGNSLKAPWK